VTVYKTFTHLADVELRQKRVRVDLEKERRDPVVGHCIEVTNKPRRDERPSKILRLSSANGGCYIRAIQNAIVCEKTIWLQIAKSTRGKADEKQEEKLSTAIKITQ
jgi:hypothetical protein